MNPATGIVKHAVYRFVSVLCVALVLGAIIYAGYITFWKPHHNPIRTTEQIADQIVNITNEEADKTFFLGIKILGIRIGISK